MDKSFIITLFAAVVLTCFLYYLDKRKSDPKFEEKFILIYALISLFGMFLLGILAIFLSIFTFFYETNVFYLFFGLALGLFLLWQKSTEMFHFFVTHRRVSFKARCRQYFQYKHRGESDLFF